MFRFYSLILVSFFGFFSIAGQVSPSKKVTTVQLADVLRNIGDRFDCYFTLEIALTNGDHRYALDGQMYSASPLMMDLRSSLETLRLTAPNLDYLFSEKNSRVIHILDTRLRSLDLYGVSSQVSEFNFEGEFPGLVKEISKRGVKVSSGGMIDTRELLTVDRTSKIKVRDYSGAVRDLLTESISFKDRGRLLWIGETEIEKQPTTYLRLRK